VNTDTIELGAVLAAGRPPLAEVLARPGTRVALLAGSRDPNAKATLILLDDYGPAFVVKVPTTRPAQRAVRNEGDALSALAERRLGPLAATIPRAVGYLSSEGLVALVSTALPGVPMTVGYHGWRHTARRRNVRRDFAAAGAWLADLQDRTVGPRQRITLPAEASAVIRQRFRDHPDIAPVSRRLAVAAERLGAFSTPRTVVHGDYWFGNLLLRRGRVVGVVDWESAVMSGEPLRDVARFPLSYALYLDRHTRAGRRIAGHQGLRAADWGAGIVAMLSGDGAFAATAGGYVSAALGRLGVPGHMWREVLIAGLADIAATADHQGFARQHLDVLAGLAVDRPAVPAPRRAVLRRVPAPVPEGRR
jgi:hypothetical protein